MDRKYKKARAHLNGQMGECQRIIPVLGKLEFLPADFIRS